jgi:hypothetical protein
MRNQSNLNITYAASKSLGLDPGYGSSAFGIVATQFVDGQIQIIYADQFERPDFNQMLNVVWNLTNYFHFTPENSQIYVDAANPSFIKSLKIQRGEREDYDQAIAEYKHIFPGYDWTTATDMFIVPVNFAQEHKKMLLHAKMLLEDKEDLVAINPKFDKLITSLRTAVEKGEGTLDTISSCLLKSAETMITLTLGLISTSLLRTSSRNSDLLATIHIPATPSFTKLIASSRPNPWEPPVINAYFLANLFICY